MSTRTSIDVTTIDPIDHAEAHDLAVVQYRRFAELLERVEPAEWDRATDCEGWSVRDMAGHVLGAMRSAASMRELGRQQRTIRARVRRDGGNEVDHMTAVQIELTAELTPEELVAECGHLVVPAARGRKRTPAPLRRFVRIPVEMGSIAETWRLGYLVDVILTRDTFMHRVDIARAIDVELDLDEHDRRLVADIVSEWARRHDQPFDMVLTGQAGGHYRSGPGGMAEPIEIDAVEFCRALSGRSSREGLMTQQVPF